MSGRVQRHHSAANDADQRGGGNGERRGGFNGHLHRASRRLRPRYAGPGDARSRGGTTERRDEVQSLLDVLVPMSLHLRDASYFDLHVDWGKISEFLRRRCEDWPAARDEVIALASRLEKSDGHEVAFSAEDMSVLGGVAGALDSECSRLFGKLYRR